MVVSPNLRPGTSPAVTLKVLIVDDDPEVADAVGMCFALRWQEASVLVASDAEKALELVSSENPDVVILDLGLPDRSGFEVCTKIRERSMVPIVMLTARGDELNKIRGFELGADDYVTKPFSHIELLARVRAVIRRAAASPVGGVEPTFERGGLRFDFGGHRVSLQGQHVPLTPTEYSVLYQLTKNYPNVVPHRTLLAKVWGPDYVDQGDYLKVHVQRIRNKFSTVDAGLDLVANERGVGYRLQLEE